jgi:hypothetical protein
MTPTDFAMTKQILKLQKTLVQNNIKAQALWLNHGERLARTCLEQTGMMPDEARRTWEYGSDMLQSGRQTLESMVDAQFTMIAGWLNPARTQS